jgi:hypothetical protein
LCSTGSRRPPTPYLSPISSPARCRDEAVVRIDTQEPTAPRELGLVLRPLDLAVAKLIGLLDPSRELTLDIERRLQSRG